jgi:hypothetical protein
MRKSLGAAFVGTVAAGLLLTSGTAGATPPGPGVTAKTITQQTAAGGRMAARRPSGMERVGVWRGGHQRSDGGDSVALGSRRAGPFRARRDPARLSDDAFVDVMEIAEDIDQALNIVGP